MKNYLQWVYQWGKTREVYLPRPSTGDGCDARHGAGYVCSRVRDHGGRHAACGMSRLVYAVWA